MGWLRELAVASGHVWLKPDEGEELRTVEGLLELADPFWVWFQDMDCAVPSEVSDASGKYRVIRGRVALESRLEPDIPEPDDLLDVCQQLLCPDAEEGQQNYGYVFSARLPLEIGETLSVRFKDTTFWGRDGTFVEFVRHESPFVLVAHERVSLVTTKPDEFELMLRLKNRWPLEEE